MVCEGDGETYPGIIALSPYYLLCCEGDGEAYAGIIALSPYHIWSVKAMVKHVQALLPYLFFTFYALMSLVRLVFLPMPLIRVWLSLSQDAA